MDCLFCKIVNGEIPSTKVFENEHVIAFKDIQPLAKEHYLFIAKNHSRDVNDLVNSSEEDLVYIFRSIKEFTEASPLKDEGFRVVTNQGPNGLQSVFHTHFHVLGGEKLGGFGVSNLDH